MSLPAFLATLFESGSVQVPQAREISRAEREEASEVLAEFERAYRLSLAGTPPAFELETACHAAETLYRLCQCLVYRELDPHLVLSPQTLPHGGPLTAADDYSADLVFRFLPDVWRLARDASENDPLVLLVLELATRWPLSSVGIPGLADSAIERFAGDRFLLILYVDRIIKRRDRSRVGDRRVRDMIQTAVGAHPELAGELTAAIAALE